MSDCPRAPEALRIPANCPAERQPDVEILKATLSVLGDSMDLVDDQIPRALIVLGLAVSILAGIGGLSRAGLQEHIDGCWSATVEDPFLHDLVRDGRVQFGPKVEAE